MVQVELPRPSKVWLALPWQIQATLEAIDSAGPKKRTDSRRPVHFGVAHFSTGAKKIYRFFVLAVWGIG
jgi:hypothetical protein